MRMLAATALILQIAASQAFAGDAEVKAGQSVIDAQIKSFLAGDDMAAYSYAAPNIRRLYPTLEAFMNMVRSGYQPVYRPRSYAFGKAREPSASSLVQEVLVVGPDGKTYQAVYTLELQPDGSFRITGVSLNEAQSLTI